MKEIGTIKNLYPYNMSNMFNSCKMLRYLPEFENLNMNRIYEYNYASATAPFQDCNSLREVPKELLEKICMPNTTSYFYTPYTNMFNRCYALDEIIGVSPRTGKIATNMFSTTFGNCSRAKDIIFAVQDDGTPYTVNWSKQTIDLSSVGFSINGSRVILDTNSGITADKEVSEDESYQRLKNDPDWFTSFFDYSRYNKLSAINTINSLPDVSQGTGNAIRFKGVAGSKTDGGAINTMTEEEIAVAASKGWTVTFG